MQNPYIPNSAKIEKITEETEDIRTLKIVFLNKKLCKDFSYRPGQFIELSVYGIGEAPFCLSSSPTRQGYIECSIKRLGKVTQAVHELEEGDIVGIRGPYGNGFPVEDMWGKNLIFVAGGIGVAPLRSLIWYCLDNRKDFRDITIIYGARTVGDLVYKEELKKWEQMPRVKTVLTVDPGGETSDWKEKIGLVPKILEEVNPSPKDSIVVTCGPPIMIKFTLLSLEKMKFSPEQIITTLERQMQCGIGKCGHCMISHLYVCKDGPVFTYAQIKEFTEKL
ncbi:MAG: FAD/NAD(P)-binding protein [bacterium]